MLLWEYALGRGLADGSVLKGDVLCLVLFVVWGGTALLVVERLVLRLRLRL